MNSLAEDAVVATNDDAASCKLSSVLKGYYQDSFLTHLVPHKIKSNLARRSPEINRGYYARSASISFIVEQFVANHPSCQIISLGAGYDSLYWRLKSHNFRRPDGESTSPQFNYVEIDMGPVTMHKMMAIKRHKELSSMLANIRPKNEGLLSDSYQLISADLRKVEQSGLEEKLLNDCQLNPKIPTLCIAECVLVYMPMNDSHSLIRWFGSHFEHLSVLVYEQCNMQDRFGEVMLNNLNDRNCDLLGVGACRSLDSQQERYKTNGLSHTKGWTLSEVYNQVLSRAEIARIESLEFLDEKELLEQLLYHYCLVLGSNREIDWLSDEQYWLAKAL